MPASIIGSLSQGGKILRRSDYAREIVGLETLTEIYTIRSADRQTILPQKDVTHSAFSSATTKFSRMAVETASVRQQDGDISEMTVAFVGVTSETTLPPAQIKYLPTTGAGIYGAPITIEISFVTDITESEFAGGQFAKNLPPPSKFGQAFIKMPTELNGTTLPSHPREPFSRAYGNVGTVTYLGYCLDSLDSVRRGQFLVARAIFKEKQIASGDVAFAQAFTRL